MKNKTSYLSIIFIAISAFFLASCEDNKHAKTASTADDKAAKKTEQAMAEASRAVEYPTIKNFFEKKMFKKILELRDQSDLVRYAYYTDMNGGKHFLGKCLGYGLPYSIQYTNPERVAINTHYAAGGGASWSKWGTLPQPDPNGLFMPEGLSATWLILIHPETGEPEPMYVEQEIMVSPWPLHDIK